MPKAQLTPDVVADGTLDRLEHRRVEWRAKRDAGEVSLTDLMPLETESERHWAYYVPQPIPEDAVEHAPKSVRDLKILDPAVGSGHFLVVAFDLLFALYREEAKHRGEQWTDQAIAERILEHNLHGIDLDPRAVQIAAAALWLKAQLVAPQAEIKQLNLVASNLGISRLADNDPSLVELRRVIQDETGIPGKLTMQIVEALRGADHLGSLLKIDQAIEAAIAAYEEQTGWKNKAVQITLFPDGTKETKPRPISREWATTGILSALENFLSRHTSSEELGLRLAGEQLAAGVRFVRLVQEGTYDLIVANPPYQGTSKMADAKYVSTHYKLAKADLFAAFLLRGLELVREHGVSAMLTMRNWMFIKQYSEYREMLFADHTLRAIGDVSWGAFREMRDNPVAISIVERGRTTQPTLAVAIAPTDPQERVRTQEEFYKKGSGMLCHVGRHTFEPAALKVVPEWPLVYWWDRAFLKAYSEAGTVGANSPARKGVCTSNNGWFIRRPWEISVNRLRNSRSADPNCHWAPYVMGAAGKAWIEPVSFVLEWSRHGLMVKVLNDYIYSSYSRTIQNQHLYFRKGVAFTTIGSAFTGRSFRVPSIFDTTGCSVFGANIANTTALFNSSKARSVLTSLNPTIHFTNGDVNRLPLFPIENADDIFSLVETAFTTHEAHREPSVEFKQPGSSPWRAAQKWAQLAVDRPEGTPLPEYVEQLDPEPPTDHVSFAIGVALGRFGANGEGILDPTQDDLAHALPAGILFLDGALGDDDRRDSLGHTATQIIHDNWSEYGSQIDKKRSLRDWLREKFFADVHKGMYETRPIHWPLSSAKKTFVAWVTIHRWTDQTLRVLLADHLEPALKRLDGEITDLTSARNSADKKQVRSAEDRYADVKVWRDELAEFIRQVQECAERGPEPPDAKKSEREVDARYNPDLDDGVMINSAALWPLLQPHWKDPQKWWKQLVAAKGKKDYDWSHLAMRYWPTRVDEKCQLDPSLGVAHGCFWKYHPARAWAWELRLQDEIAPDFRIEESAYRGDGGETEHRANYLRDNPTEVLEAIEKEVLRRKRKQKKPQPELTILEPGLWSAVPEECWDLELRMIRKQNATFRLLSPDEAESREKYILAHPDKHDARQRLIQSLKVEDLMEEDDAVPDDEAEEVDA